MPAPPAPSVEMAMWPVASESARSPLRQGRASTGGMGVRPRQNRLTGAPSHHSWAPGMHRQRILQPMRPKTSLEELRQLHRDRTFGGIERRPLGTEMPSSEESFALRSFAAAHSTMPVRIVAFVNSKSGGMVGGLLMKILSDSIGGGNKAFEGMVCDLSEPQEPDATLAKLKPYVSEAEETPLRLLVCGGDGTVTWILTALEQCESLASYLHLLPVAVVPLGTGNDLARSLGWGGSLSRVSDVLQYLKWLVGADTVFMDQWRMLLRPHEELPEDHKLRTLGSHPQLVERPDLTAQCLNDIRDSVGDLSGEGRQVFVAYWQNYFSIGTDAKIAFGVERSRRSTRVGRCCFRSGLGKVCYAFHGVVNAISRAKLSRIVSSLKVIPPSFRSLESEDQEEPQEEIAVDHSHASDLDPPLRERRIHCSQGRLRQLVVMNINSYGAGLKVLPDVPPAKVPPKPHDGFVELLATRNSISFAGILMGCVRPTYLDSSQFLAMTLSEGEYMQLDGEAWQLDVGADIIIEPHRRVAMLRAPATARWRGHCQQDFWNE
mmetsp:Transcript_3689/g.8071  ORF Transcript_3689/g.8071 Transcript_3689/m.8071 type:complete len:547 (-) Transcript_3689:20-1660(-)